MVYEVYKKSYTRKSTTSSDLKRACTLITTDSQSILIKSKMQSSQILVLESKCINC